MKSKIVLVIVIFIVSFYSCKSNRKPISEQEILKQEIKTSEQELLGTDEIDPKLANGMIGLYEAYVQKFPEDANCAEYLFKAADIAMNFDRSEDAIAFLSQIEKDYIDFDKYSTCIFLIAFVYDNNLGDVENARKYYNKFIAKYPQHNLVKNAEAALEYLEIDDEDLIELFNKMNDTLQ